MREHLPWAEYLRIRLIAFTATMDAGWERSISLGATARVHA